MKPGDPALLLGRQGLVVDVGVADEEVLFKTRRYRLLRSSSFAPVGRAAKPIRAMLYKKDRRLRGEGCNKSSHYY